MKNKDMTSDWWNWTNAGNVLFWGFVLMFFSYVASFGAYAGIGSTNAAMDGGFDANLTTAPRYVLISNKPVYDANGFEVVYHAAQDKPFVTFEVNKDLNQEVKVTSNTLGVLLFATFVYFVGIALTLVFKSVFSTDTTTNKNLFLLASVAYFLIMIVLMIMVQGDLMYILGNNDKAAAWLTTGVIIALVGMYFVNEHDNIYFKVPKNDSTQQTENVVKPIYRWTIFIASILVAFYLLSMLLGVTILEPLHAIRATGIPTTYRATLGLYLVIHFMELGIFLFSTGARVAAASGNKNAVMVVDTVRNEMSVVFRHGLLFALAAVYAFAPMKDLARTGFIGNVPAPCPTTLAPTSSS